MFVFAQTDDLTCGMVESSMRELPMIAFKVEGMFSSRSAGAIVKSVKLLDHHAVVRVDLVSHRVEVEPTWADVGDLGEAIERAGFRPAFVSSDVSPDWLGFVPSARQAWNGAVDVVLPLD